MIPANFYGGSAGVLNHIIFEKSVKPVYMARLCKSAAKLHSCNPILKIFLPAFQIPIPISAQLFATAQGIKVHEKGSSNQKRLRWEWLDKISSSK